LNQAHFLPAAGAANVRIRPSGGSVRGGTAVEVAFASTFDAVRAEGFRCRFGDADGSGAGLIGSKGFCTSPPHGPGDVTLDVVSVETSQVVATATFRFHELLTISRVRPSSIPAGSATSVSITGGVFLQDARYACATNTLVDGSNTLVDGSSGLVKHAATLISSSLVRCALSPLPVASFLLDVTQDGETLAEFPIELLVSSRPVVSGVSPNVVFDALPQAVSIAGANFHGAVRCGVAQGLGHGRVLSATEIECLVPAGPPGEYAIKVTSKPTPCGHDCAPPL